MDEEELEGVLGALGEIGYSMPATEEAKDYSRQILDEYLESQDGPYADHERELLGRMEDNAAKVREALRSARERVSQQRVSPVEYLLAASAGFGRPTRTGSFGETLSNVSEELLGPLRASREMGVNRDAALSDIDLAMAGVDKSVLDAELQLAELDRRGRSGITREALRMLGRSSGSARSRVRDERIAELYGRFQEQGMSPSLAYRRSVDLVDGNVRLTPMPELGIVSVLDEVNRAAYEVPIEAVQGLVPGLEDMSTEQPAGAGAAPTGQVDRRPAAADGEFMFVGSALEEAGIPVDEASLWDLAGYGTGPWSAAREVGTVASGMTGLDNLGVPRAQRTIVARQILKGEMNNLIRAMSINPRFPVGEINRLREELSLEPKMWDDVDAMRDRMVGLRAYLTRRLAEVEAGARDPAMPASQRAADRITARDIGAFLKILRVPDDVEMPTVGGGGVTPPIIDESEIPEGLTADEWRWMTPEERALWDVPSSASTVEDDDMERAGR